MKRKRYVYFCGIDVGKRKHAACIIDQDGNVIVRLQFNNDRSGFDKIQNTLTQAGGNHRVLVAMEATGHYWYNLHDFLQRLSYDVIVLNAIQTAQQARMGIRKGKTDNIDARHVAVLVKNGEHKPALVPGEVGMTCRQLTRSRYRMTRQIASLKQLLHAHLHPVWPEYERLFTKPFCATGLRLLQMAPTPADVLTLDPERLAEFIYKSSRGRYGPIQAEKIYKAAKHSVGMLRGRQGTRVVIGNLIAQMEAWMPIRKSLDTHISDLAEQLPSYILTLPGISQFSAVSLYGETDPIQAFDKPARLVAFAGLDMPPYQTGQYEAPRRHISKRGSPYLRKTLWTMAHRACYQEGQLRDYWIKKRANGLHYLAAVTAVAVKLCHISWRILVDGREFLPKPEQHES